ncbi:MAG: hypothetical protein ACRD6U_10395 [Nitrososphaeraceae archaeon]
MHQQLLEQFIIVGVKVGKSITPTFEHPFTTPRRVFPFSVLHIRRAFTSL